jgi:hypothetical protein
MTFNLHEDQPPDSPNSWEKRRDLCISVITSYSPMILCTQQGLSSSPYTRLYMNVCVCCSVDLGRACFLIEMVDLGLHWPVFWRWVFLLLGCGSIFLLKCLASEQRFGWMMFLIEEFLILTLLNHTPFEWWTGLGFSNLFFGVLLLLHIVWAEYIFINIDDLAFLSLNSFHIFFFCLLFRTAIPIGLYSAGLAR